MVTADHRAAMPKSRLAKSGLASIILLPADKKLGRPGPVHVATWQSKSWSSVHMVKVAARADIERVACGVLPFHFPDLNLFFRLDGVPKVIQEVTRRFQVLSKLVGTFLHDQNSHRTRVRKNPGDAAVPPPTPSFWAWGRVDVAKLPPRDRALLLQALGANGDLKAHSLLPLTKVAVQVCKGIGLTIMSWMFTM